MAARPAELLRLSDGEQERLAAAAEAEAREREAHGGKLELVDGNVDVVVKSPAPVFPRLCAAVACRNKQLATGACTINPTFSNMHD